MALPPKQIGPEVMNQIGPPNDAAQPQAGMFDFLNSMPLGLALMQSGLSISDGVPTGQAFGQGLGLYQQIIGNQAATAAAGRKANLEDAKYKLDVFKAGQGDKDLAFKEKELLSKEKIEADRLKAMKEIANMKASAKADDKTGVDATIMDKALSLAELNAVDGVVDPDAVYSLYNSMAPENRQVYKQVNTTQLRGYLELMDESPQAALDYMEKFGSVYGPAAMARLSASWDKMQSNKILVKQREEDKAAAAEKKAAADKKAADARFNEIRKTSPDPFEIFFKTAPRM